MGSAQLGWKSSVASPPGLGYISLFPSSSNRAMPRGTGTSHPVLRGPGLEKAPPHSAAHDGPGQSQSKFKERERGSGHHLHWHITKVHPRGMPPSSQIPAAFLQSWEWLDLCLLPDVRRRRTDLTVVSDTGVQEGTQAKETEDEVSRKQRPQGGGSRRAQQGVTTLRSTFLWKELQERGERHLPLGKDLVGEDTPGSSSPPARAFYPCT